MSKEITFLERWFDRVWLIGMGASSIRRAHDHRHSLIEAVGDKAVSGARGEFGIPASKLAYRPKRPCASAR